MRDRLKGSTVFIWMNIFSASKPSSETIGKTSLNDTKHILVFDQRFSANHPGGFWSVLLVSAKRSSEKSFQLI